MTLLSFVITLVVGGLVWFLIDRYLPLPDPIKLIIRVVAVIALIFLLLALFGVMQMPFALK